MIVAVGVGVACAGVSAVSARQARAAPDGIYSASQASRGEALFKANCQACHGAQLTGTEFAPGLTGVEFSARWRGRAVGELFDLMRATMPMNSPGGLSAQQNADILAFLLMKAGIPAGKADLPSASDALHPIKIPPSRP